MSFNEIANEEIVEFKGNKKGIYKGNPKVYTSTILVSYFIP